MTSVGFAAGDIHPRRYYVAYLHHLRLFFELSSVLGLLVMCVDTAMSCLHPANFTQHPVVNHCTPLHVPNAMQ